MGKHRKKVDKNCIICDKFLRYVHPRIKYCRKCLAKTAQRRRIGKSSWKICAICGKEFRYNHKYLYCSDECAKTMQKTCGHKEEKDALIKLLYRVCEHFGYFYQKYEKNNINITYKKGHKLE